MLTSGAVFEGGCMLRWFDGNHDLTVNDIPHRKDYNEWLNRLSTERSAVFTYIESLINSRIHTSSWMPGPNWKNTPLQLIYDKAAKGSRKQAAQCFGLILHEIMINRPEQWYCKKDSEVAEGTIYWRA